jgi:hypothetical protein
MVRREFGFVSADQICEGKMSGATPAARADLRNERREVRGRFIGK